MGTLVHHKPAANFHPDLNVQLTPNAQRILHVSVKNVKIHAIRQLVVEMLNAKSETIVPYALA
jgi:hypothetical protein